MAELWILCVHRQTEPHQWITPDKQWLQCPGGHVAKAEEVAEWMLLQEEGVDDT